MRQLTIIAVAVFLSACGGEPVHVARGIPTFSLSTGRVAFEGRTIEHVAVEAELAAIDPAPKVVGLIVDRDVPWVEVQWAVAAIAERDIRRVRLVGARSGIEFTVWPSILGCVYPEFPDQNSLLLRIAIGADGTYRCGEESAPRVADLDSWVERARARVQREELRELCVELWPRKNAPWGFVVDAFTRLRKAGVPVDFSGYTDDRDVHLDESFFDLYRTGDAIVVPIARGAFNIAPEEADCFRDVDPTEEPEEEPELDEPEEIHQERIIRDPEPELPDRD